MFAGIGKGIGNIFGGLIGAFGKNKREKQAMEAQSRQNELSMLLDKFSPGNDSLMKFVPVVVALVGGYLILKK